MVADADERSTRETGEPHRTIWFGGLRTQKHAAMSERASTVRVCRLAGMSGIGANHSRSVYPARRIC